MRHAGLVGLADENEALGMRTARLLDREGLQWHEAGGAGKVLGLGWGGLFRFGQALDLVFLH